MTKPMGLPNGPYPLTAEGVNGYVTLTMPGAYALGKRGDDGVFYIDYVGRSDDDVAERLFQHVGEYYPQFHFAYNSTALEAFEKECNLYHDFTPPNNKVHPARPKGANRKCPRCKIFD